MRNEPARLAARSLSACFALDIESDIDDSDFDAPVLRASLCRCAWNARAGFAIAARRHDAGIQAALHQVIADGPGSSFGQCSVVFVATDVIGMAIDVDGIAFRGQENSSDAAQQFAVLRPEI